MKIYLTLEDERTAGPDIHAHSFDEADAIAESWRKRKLVPPTFIVVGELEEYEDIDFHWQE